MEFMKILLGVVLIGLTLRALKLSIATFNWQKTSGVVGIGPIDEYRGYIRVKGNQLAYGYHVGGKEHFSKRIVAAIPDNLFVYLIFFNSTSFAQNNFKHGQTVDVFINPNNPSQSCLIQGGAKYVIIEFAIWCVLYMLVLASWQ